MVSCVATENMFCMPRLHAAGVGTHSDLDQEIVERASIVVFVLIQINSADEELLMQEPPEVVTHVMRLVRALLPRPLAQLTHVASHGAGGMQNLIRASPR